MNTTFLILTAVIVLAVALGGVIAFLYVRARQSEKVVTAAQPQSQKDLLRQKEEQVTKIRQRIEQLYQQQQQEQRVQNAQLSQQMDDVKLHLETNDRKVDGLRSELHHEIDRRNQELDELRHQLAGALDAFWKTHDALPEGQQTAPLQLAAANPPAPSSSPAQQAEAPPSVPSAPAAAVPQAPAPPPASAPPPSVPPTAAPDFGVEEIPASPAPPAGDGLQWQSFDFAASETTQPEPSEAAPTGGDFAMPEDDFAAPSGDSTAAPLPSFASFDSLSGASDFGTPEPPAPDFAAPDFAAPDFAAPDFSTPDFATPEPTPPPPVASKPAVPEPPAPQAPASPPESAAPARPPDADVLTKISGIDDDLEAQLYSLGITKLDQIARWSRTEARRVAQELGLRP
ncbi:MAG: hypothetical protein AAFQ53_17800, partial [Bacteroidota bacterium]